MQYPKTKSKDGKPNCGFRRSKTQNYLAHGGPRPRAIGTAYLGGSPVTKNSAGLARRELLLHVLLGHGHRLLLHGRLHGHRLLLLHTRMRRLHGHHRLVLHRLHAHGGVLRHARPRRLHRLVLDDRGPKLHGLLPLLLLHLLLLLRLLRPRLLMRHVTEPSPVSAHAHVLRSRVLAGIAAIDTRPWSGKGTHVGNIDESEGVTAYAYCTMKTGCTFDTIKKVCMAYE